MTPLRDDLAVRADAALAIRKVAETRVRGIGVRIGFAVFGLALATWFGEILAAIVWITVVTATQIIDQAIYRRILKRPSDPTRFEVISCHVSAFAATVAYSGISGIMWFTNASGAQAFVMAWLCGATLHVIIQMHQHRGVMLAALAGHLGYMLGLPLWSLVTGTGLTLSGGAAVMLSVAAFATHAVAAYRLYDQASASLRKASLEAEKRRRVAEEANHAKSAFLAVMSHELRTPMNGVLGMTRALGATTLDERQKDYVDTVLDSGEMLLALLNDILDASKIEAGRMEVKRARMDLHALVDHVSSMWSAQARAKGLSFTVEMEPETPRWISCDPVRLRQILFNLLSNAVKFTQEGGVRVQVRASAQAGDERTIEFSVIDTGPGIAPEDSERLFNAFEQADSSTTRQFGGTGLGLAICRSLARLLGGDVTLQSVPGEGAAFTLKILAAVNADDRERLIDASAVASTEPDGEPGAPHAPRLLIAEDNAVNRRVVAAFLAELDCEATMVGNGAEALAALRHTRFDAVLMDVQMPVMDGLEATERLRTSGGPNAAIPVIALTADGRDGFEQKCRDAGMTDFVLKPFDMRELHAAVSAAIDLSARRRAEDRAA